MRPFFENVVDTLRSSAAARRHDVLQARSEVRAALARHRSFRRDAAGTTKRALRRNRASVIGSLKSAMAPVMFKAPAAESPARTVDRSLWTALQHAVERSGVWELWPNRRDLRRHDEADDLLQRQVLHVIERHPEGIRALEVGNELGVDWRGVLGIARTLIEAGKVEQVEHEFYPVAQASRRW
jgi:hypothetical protein